jgi:predicted PurR-regulated permease PerM
MCNRMATETRKPETPPPPTRPEPSRSLSELHIWQIAAVRDIFWIGLGLSILLFTYYLRSIFTPVLIGLLLAYIFNPMISYLEHRWRVPRPVTISVLLGFLLVTFVGMVAWVVPMLVEQTVSLMWHIPGYIVDLMTYLERQDVIEPESVISVRSLTTLPQATPQELMQTIYNWTGQAFGYVGTVITTGTYIVLVMMLIPIYFFSFAWHFDSLVEKIDQNLPPSHRPRIVQIIRQMDQAVSGFFRGRLIVAFVMSAVFMLSWYLAGVPYWFLLGILAGVLNIVPYLVVVVWPLAVLLKWLEYTADTVTPVAVAKPAAIQAAATQAVTTQPWLFNWDWAWATHAWSSGTGAIQGAASQAAATQAVSFNWDWLWIFLAPTIAYLVAQFLDNWIITPIIQAKSSNLSAVTIMIVVLVGGAIGGLYGLLLAIPVAACMKILAKEVLLPHMQAWAKET